MKKFIFALLAVATPLAADRMTIHNRTPRDLYMAVYYLGMKLPFKEQPVAKIATEIILVEADTSAILERPVRKVGYDRELVFVERKEELTPELTKQQLEKYHSKNVGYLQGDVFYVGDKDAKFYGYTTVEWNVIKSILDAARAKVMASVPQIVENRYKNSPAKVRLGNELCDQEKSFVSVRMPRAKAAMEKALNQPVERVPKIAIVCSGGGYRAMLFCLGALIGAHNAGILDMTTYLVGLSGSTWAISGWLLSDQSLQVYHDWVVSNLNRGLKEVSAQDVSLMGDHLLCKYFYDQPYGIVDLYGSLLANELFTRTGNRKQRQTLSAQAHAIRNAMHPMPIYTAIAAESSKAEEQWYEFSPFEVGAQWMGAYVPSWAFGRKFKEGVSVNFAPEQNFGVLMGTFGLAIGLTITRLVSEIKLKEKAPSFIVGNIIDSILSNQGESRITSADYRNFARGLPNVPLSDKRKLKMVDAGISYNLPYPPISGERTERKADIIIFVDASAGDFPADLKKAEAYARAHKLQFPPVDFSQVNKRAVSVFKSANPQVPVVIYVPRVVDQTLFANPEYAQLAKEFAGLKTFDIEACITQGPCGTFNFSYSEADARKLTNLGRLNMMAARSAVIEAIKSLQPKVEK